LIGWDGGLPPHLEQKKQETVSDFLLGGAAGGRLVFSFACLG